MMMMTCGVIGYSFYLCLCNGLLTDYNVFLSGFIYPTHDAQYPCDNASPQTVYAPPPRTLLPQPLATSPHVPLRSIHAPQPWRVVRPARLYRHGKPGRLLRGWPPLCR